MTGLSNFY